MPRRSYEALAYPRETMRKRLNRTIYIQVQNADLYDSLTYKGLFINSVLERMADECHRSRLALEEVGLTSKESRFLVRQLGSYRFSDPDRPAPEIRAYTKSIDAAVFKSAGVYKKLTKKINTNAGHALYKLSLYYHALGVGEGVFTVKL